MSWNVDQHSSFAQTPAVFKYTMLARQVHNMSLVAAVLCCCRCCWQQLKPEGPLPAPRKMHGMVKVGGWSLIYHTRPAALQDAPALLVHVCPHGGNCSSRLCMAARLYASRVSGDAAADAEPHSTLFNPQATFHLSVVPFTLRVLWFCSLALRWSCLVGSGTAAH